MDESRQVIQAKTNEALNAAKQLQDWLQLAKKWQEAQEQVSHLLKQIEQAQRIIAELEAKRAQLE